MLGVAEPWLWIQVTPTRRGGACLPGEGKRGGQSQFKKHPRALVTPYDAPWPGPPLPASQNGQRSSGESRGWRVARASFFPPGPPRLASVQGRGADRGCPQLEIPLRLEGRGALRPPPTPPHSPSPGTWQQAAQLCLPGAETQAHPCSEEPRGRAHVFGGVAWREFLQLL